MINWNRLWRGSKLHMGTSFWKLQNINQGFSFYIPFTHFSSRLLFFIASLISLFFPSFVNSIFLPRITKIDLNLGLLDSDISGLYEHSFCIPSTWVSLCPWVLWWKSSHEIYIRIRVTGVVNFKVISNFIQVNCSPSCIYWVLDFVLQWSTFLNFMTYETIFHTRQRACLSNFFEIKVGWGTILAIYLLKASCIWGRHFVVTAWTPTFLMIESKILWDGRLRVRIAWFLSKLGISRDKGDSWRCLFNRIWLWSRSMFARGWRLFISLRRSLAIWVDKEGFCLFHKAVTFIEKSLFSI